MAYSNKMKYYVVSYYDWDDDGSGYRYLTKGTTKDIALKKLPKYVKDNIFSIQEITEQEWNFKLALIRFESED